MFLSPSSSPPPPASYPLTRTMLLSRRTWLKPSKAVKKRVKPLTWSLTNVETPVAGAVLQKCISMLDDCVRHNDRDKLDHVYFYVTKHHLSAEPIPAHAQHHNAHVATTTPNNNTAANNALLANSTTASVREIPPELFIVCMDAVMMLCNFASLPLLFQLFYTLPSTPTYIFRVKLHELHYHYHLSEQLQDDAKHQQIALCRSLLSYLLTMIPHLSASEQSPLVHTMLAYATYVFHSLLPSKLSQNTLAPTVASSSSAAAATSNNSSGSNGNSITMTLPLLSSILVAYETYVPSTQHDVRLLLQAYMMLIIGEDYERENNSNSSNKEKESSKDKESRLTLDRLIAKVWYHFRRLNSKLHDKYHVLSFLIWSSRKNIKLVDSILHEIESMGGGKQRPSSSSKSRPNATSDASAPPNFFDGADIFIMAHKILYGVINYDVNTLQALWQACQDCEQKLINSSNAVVSSATTSSINTSDKDTTPRSATPKLAPKKLKAKGSTDSEAASTVTSPRDLAMAEIKRLEELETLKKQKKLKQEQLTETSFHISYLYSLIAMVAFKHHMLVIASNAAQRAMLPKRKGLHIGWIQGEMISIQIDLHAACEKHYSGEDTQVQYNEKNAIILHHVKLLHATLWSSTRLPPPQKQQISEEITCLIWNLSQPLLFTNQMILLHKIYKDCATILQDHSCNLHELRVGFHYVISIIEYQLDYVEKSQHHLRLALALDPTLPHNFNSTNTPEHYLSFLRKYDRYLLPMTRILEVKSMIYEEPEGEENIAIKWIEQAKEMKTPHIKRNLFIKAIEQLDSKVVKDMKNWNTSTDFSPFNVTLSSSSTQKLSQLSSANYTIRFRLWYDVLLYAFEARQYDIFFVAVAHLSEYELSALLHADEVVKMIHAHQLQMIICHELIELQGHKFGHIKTRDENQTLIATTSSNKKAEPSSSPPSTGVKRSKKKKDDTSSSNSDNSNKDVARSPSTTPRASSTKPANFDDAKKCEPVPTAENDSNKADKKKVVLTHEETHRLLASQYETLLLTSLSHALDHGLLLLNPTHHHTLTSITGLQQSQQQLKQYDILINNTCVIFWKLTHAFIVKFLKQEQDKLLSSNTAALTSSNNNDVTDDSLFISEELKQTLLKIHDVLMSKLSQYKNIQLLCQYTLLIIRMYENNLQYESAYSFITPIIQVLQSQIHIGYQASFTYHSRYILEAYARISKKLKKDVNFSLLSESKEALLYVYLELLRLPSSYVTNDEKKKLLHDVIIPLQIEYHHEVYHILSLSLLQLNGEYKPAVNNDDKQDGRKSSSSPRKSPSSRDALSNKKRRKQMSDDNIAVAYYGPNQRKFNPTSYATFRSNLRETYLELWYNIAIQSNELKLHVQTIQICYTSLSTSPLQVESQDHLLLINTVAQAKSRPSTGRKGKDDRPASPRKQAKHDAVSKYVPNPDIQAMLAMIPDVTNKESIEEISSTRCYYYSYLSLLLGSSLFALLDPTVHDQTSQDSLRRRIGEWFVRASQWTGRAITRRKEEEIARAAHPNEPKLERTVDIELTVNLALQACKLYWNVVLPMTYESLTRELLVVSLASLLKNLQELFETLVSLPNYSLNLLQSSYDPSFRCQLYLLYFECLKSIEDYQTGYSATSTALQYLPAIYRKSIWESRILFMSKLEMDVGVGVMQMKDNSPIAQSKIWISLARQCQTKKDKFDFYVKAIDVLEETPLEQVEYCIEFGEWLYVNQFPVADAQDQLYYAADILNQVENPSAQGNASEHWDHSEADARSHVSGSHVSASPSNLSRNSTRHSLASSSLSRLSNRRLTRVPSNSSRSSHTSASALEGKKSSDTESTSSKHTRTMSQSPSTPASPRFLSIANLAVMVRLYTILSCMASSVNEQTEMMLVAQHYVMKIWETAYQSVNQHYEKKKLAAQTEIAASSKGTAVSGSASSANLSASKQKSVEVAPTTVASPTFTLPANYQEWIGYQVPASLRQFFQEQSSTTESTPIQLQTINKYTVPEPIIFIHFLQQVVDQLKYAGYYLHLLPILALIDLVSNDLLSSRYVSVYNSLYSSDIYRCLNLFERAQAAVAKCEPLLPTADESKLFQEMVEKREQLQKIQQELDEKSGNPPRRPLVTLSNFNPSFEPPQANSTNTSRPSSAASRNLSNMYSEDVLLTTSKLKETYTNFTPSPPPQVSSDIPIRCLWLKIVPFLIKLGKFPQAKALLSLAYRHCLAWEDTESLSYFHRYAGLVCELEGNPAGALRLQLISQVNYFGNCAIWRENIDRMVRCFQLNVDETYSSYSLAFTKSVALLQHSIQVFNEADTQFQTGSHGLEFKRARMECMIKLTEILWKHQQSKHQLHQSLGIQFMHATREAMDLIQKAKPASQLSTRHRPASSVSSVSNAGTLQSADQARLHPDHQKVYTQVFTLLEQSNKTAEEVHDTPTQLHILYTHASYLFEYAQMWALPASILKIQSSSRRATTTEILSIVTVAHQTLYNALEMLNRCESLISSLLLSTSPDGVIPAPINLSLPLQRQLSKVKILKCQILLRLFAYKSPNKIYEPRVPEKIDAPLSTRGSKDSQFSFSNTAANDESLADAIYQHQETMNAIFFEKYENVFSSEEVLVKEISLNQQALTLATAAYNYEAGNIASVGSELASAATTTTGSSAPSVKMAHHEKAWSEYYVGCCLASLFLQEWERQEDAILKQIQSAERDAQQLKWKQTVEQQSDKSRTLKGEELELYLAQQAMEAARLQEEEDEKVEEEKAALKKQKEADEEARKKQAELDAIEAAASKKKKRKSQSPRLSQKEQMKEVSKLKEAQLQAEEEKKNERVFVDFTYDTSIWSPNYLQLHIQHSDYRLKQYQLNASSEESNSKRKGSKKKDKTPKSRDDDVRSPSPGKLKGSVPPTPATDQTTHDTSAANLPALPAFPTASDLAHQSLSYLQLSIDHALRNDDGVESSRLIARASIELCSLFGTMFPQLTAKYLALHVAASTREYSLQLFELAAPYSQPETLVINRRQYLLENNYYIHTPEIENTHTFLNTYSEIWKRLSLQVDTGAQAAAADDTTTPSSDSAQSHYQSQYSTLLQFVNESQIVVTLNYDAASQSLLLSTATSSPFHTPCVSRHYLSVSELSQFHELTHLTHQIDRQIQRLTLLYQSNSCAQLDELEQKYNSYLQQFDQLFQKVFNRACLTSQSFQDKHVVLIVNAYLWQFPLESLSVFNSCQSITRDYSLHLYHTRNVSYQAAQSPLINKQQIGYIVDSNADDPHYKDDDKGDMVRVLHDLNNLSSALSPSSWLGINGASHVPVAGEWQRLFSTQSSEFGMFFYMDYEALLARFHPHLLAPLPLPSVALVFAADRAVNAKSYRRESKLKNEKTSTRLQFENCYSTGLLLSIKGVLSTVLRPHCSSGLCNAATTRSTMSRLLVGDEVGVAVRAHHSLAGEFKGLMEQPFDTLLAARGHKAGAPSLPKMSRGTSQTRTPASGGRRGDGSYSSPRGMALDKLASQPLPTSTLPSARKTASRHGRNAAGSAAQAIAQLQQATAIHDQNTPIIRTYDKWNMIVVGLGQLKMQ